MSLEITWLPRSCGIRFKNSDYKKTRQPALPLRVRTYSFAGSPSHGFDQTRDGLHVRNKSVSVASNSTDLSPTTAKRSSGERLEHGDNLGDVDSARVSLDSSAGLTDDTLSTTGSPETPATSLSSGRSSLDASPCEVQIYDFSKIDYQVERTKVLGQGLWSVVYLAEQKPVRASSSLARSSRSPGKRHRASISCLLAVKTLARRDGKDVFHQEARVLSHLQRRSAAAQYIVPFLGLDDRTDSLVFEAVVGGSIESLAGRLKQMTEVARHVELIATFPGIALDLIGGLEFLHANAVIHADIKPGNILLDITEHATQRRPVVRARYIDFSAAFIPIHADSAVHAGGTWDYMAPEQMRVQRELSTPTWASDVWSLGITLLYILVGDSPYAAACQGNRFMLREAIKTGDPVQFARIDPIARKRLAAAQGLVDCCRQALKKERENRSSAGAWLTWLEQTGT